MVRGDGGVDGPGSSLGRVKSPQLTRIRVSGSGTGHEGRVGQVPWYLKLIKSQVEGDLIYKSSKGS